MCHVWYTGVVSSMRYVSGDAVVVAGLAWSWPGSQGQVTEAAAGPSV